MNTTIDEIYELICRENQVPLHQADHELESEISAIVAKESPVGGFWEVEDGLDAEVLLKLWKMSRIYHRMESQLQGRFNLLCAGLVARNRHVALEDKCLSILVDLVSRVAFLSKPSQGPLLPLLRGEKEFLQKTQVSRAAAYMRAAIFPERGGLF